MLAQLLLLAAMALPSSPSASKAAAPALDISSAFGEGEVRPVPAHGPFRFRPDPFGRHRFRFFFRPHPRFFPRRYFYPRSYLDPRWHFHPRYFYPPYGPPPGAVPPWYW
jgi:hypothetical protein